MVKGKIALRCGRAVRWEGGALEFHGDVTAVTGVRVRGEEAAASFSVVAAALAVGVLRPGNACDLPVFVDAGEEGNTNRQCAPPGVAE